MSLAEVAEVIPAAGEKTEVDRLTFTVRPGRVTALLTSPRRTSPGLPMLAAKAVVFAVLELIVAAIAVFAVFFLFTTIIHGHIVITIGQSGVLRATIGGIFYLTVLGLLALAVGGIIRHTAGAIAAVIGLILVVPPLISLIPGTIAAHIYAYLPSVAGILIAHTTEQPGGLLSPWQGFGVLCAETAILLAVSAVLLVRRDA